MRNVQIIDVSPDDLIQHHGSSAAHVISILIDHALANHRIDEALELDRVRRAVERKLAVHHRLESSRMQS